MHWDTLKWVYEAEHPKRVSKGAFAVLVALAYSKNPKTGQCNPSIERLCQLTRIGKTSVKAAISTLKKAGIISLSSGKRMKKSNNYIIHYSAVPKKRRQSDNVNATVNASPESSNSEPNKMDKGTDIELNKVQNQTTNRSNNNKETSVRGSKSESKSLAATPVDSDFDAAALVALEWANNNELYYGYDAGGMSVRFNKDTIKYTHLYQALSYLPHPTFRDARRICRIVGKSANDTKNRWFFVGEVMNDIHSYENAHPGVIKSKHAYFFKCLNNKFAQVNQEDAYDDAYKGSDI